MCAGAEQQFGIDSLRNTQDEVWYGGIVHRNHDRASKCTAKESNHPFRAVLAPQNNVVAPANVESFEFARKLERRFGNSPVAPTLGAVSAAVNIGGIKTMLQKDVQVIGKRIPFHCCRQLPL